jgi:hypothetical protein
MADLTQLPLQMIEWMGIPTVGKCKNHSYQKKEQTRTLLRCAKFKMKVITIITLFGGLSLK